MNDMFYKLNDLFDIFDKLFYLNVKKNLLFCCYL